MSDHSSGEGGSVQIGVEELAREAGDFAVWLLRRMGLLTPERERDAARAARGWAESLEASRGEGPAPPYVVINELQAAVNEAASKARDFVGETAPQFASLATETGLLIARRLQGLTGLPEELLALAAWAVKEPRDRGVLDVLSDYLEERSILPVGAEGRVRRLAPQKGDYYLVTFTMRDENKEVAAQVAKLIAEHARAVGCDGHIVCLHPGESIKVRTGLELDVWIRQHGYVPKADFDVVSHRLDEALKEIDRLSREGARAVPGPHGVPPVRFAPPLSAADRDEIRRQALEMMQGGEITSVGLGQVVYTPPGLSDEDIDRLAERVARRVMDAPMPRARGDLGDAVDSGGEGG
jgi:hypothetical protein